MHKRDEKQRKYTFFEENSKKICVFEKKVVPLHDFSRGVGSKEPICCVMSKKSRAVQNLKLCEFEIRKLTLRS